MRFLFGASLTLFVIVVATSLAKAETKTDSAFIDVDKDCVVVSSANGNAPIDFYEAECRSFGGYRLSIAGSDLRYHPKLSYNGQDIELQHPMQFHDLSDTVIEWVYSLDVDDEGSGKIQWKGLLYEMSVADEDHDKTWHFAIRLDGANTCIVAREETAEGAKAVLSNPAAACLSAE